MGRAVGTLLLGFDYQARHFWIEALRLLRSVPDLDKVAIEAKWPRGFDDYVSWHSRPRDHDVYGRAVDVDGFQAKFHVDHSKAITAADLADPRFIGAQTSLLQRLGAAVNDAQSAGVVGRFTLVTPWHVDTQDILGSLCGSDGELRLSVLFDGTGERSETGRIRKAWRDHLELTSDAQLESLLRHLRILPRDVVATDNELGRELETAGLEPVTDASVTHPYVDLALTHVKRGKNEFDRVALEAALTAAGLWRRGPALPTAGTRLAVRSRRKGAYHLEDEAGDLLDLIPLFHDRDLAGGVSWRAVGTKLSDFVGRTVKPGTSYLLYLDAHGTIAFAAGWLLNRYDVTPMQLVAGQWHGWPPTSGEVPSGALWETTDFQLAGSGPDVAIALSVTHDVLPDVLAIASRALPEVSRVIGLAVPVPGHSSVSGGSHAAALAEEAVRIARRYRPIDGRACRFHIFAAGPNSLMFYLGRAGRALGQATVHEFDLENQHQGYTAAITFPLEDSE